MKFYLRIFLVMLLALGAFVGLYALFNHEDKVELQGYVEKNHLTLVGSFNEWDIEDSTYKMESLGDYKYRYELDTKQLETEFKIVNYNSLENEFNSSIVSNPDADYISLETDNIKLTKAGIYEILLDTKVNSMVVNLIHEYEMVTFTACYGQYVIDTYTVVKGTTWREHLISVFGINGNFQVAMETLMNVDNNATIGYCSLSEMQSLYGVTHLDDEILPTTYGRLRTVTFTYGSNFSDTFDVIEGMTMREFFLYYEENDSSKLGNFNSRSGSTGKISYCGGNLDLYNTDRLFETTYNSK